MKKEAHRARRKNRRYLDYFLQVKPKMHKEMVMNGLRRKDDAIKTRSRYQKKQSHCAKAVAEVGEFYVSSAGTEA